VAALSLPLKAQAPSDAEIQGLLEAWLKTKAEVLDGKTPAARRASWHGRPWSPPSRLKGAATWPGVNASR